MTSKCVFLLAFSFIAGSIAVPYGYNQNDASAEISQCASYCPTGSTTKFQYMPSQTYDYQYEADIKTSIPGSTEHSSLHMQAKAQIEVISTCEMVLRLSDVTLQDSDPTRYDSRQPIDSTRQFKQSLENNPLRFAFIDGTIENICPASNEEIWALNIKRGILSTFQNTMGSMQGVSETMETDVSGKCKVTYEVTSSWGTLKLKKTKNLMGCTERISAQTVFQSVGYKSESKVQSLPLMKGTHVCQQEINGQSKVLTKSECTEVHIFRPFSRENSGATTELKYKLIFQRQNEGVQSNSGISRSRVSLLYDHTVSSAEMSANLRDAQETMRKLCGQTSANVRPEAPALFASLVKHMRKLDTRTLRQLLASGKSGPCPRAESFYRDALPVLGSAASVAMIRELITSGQVTGVQAELLLTSIAFIKNPNTEMMKELQTLLTADMERASLPVSSVVHTYCQLNKPDSPEVVAIIKVFENELRSNCRTDRNPSRMLLALRAIGNAGNAAHIAPTLNRCAVNTDAPMSVRVAAVAAYRRMSCEASREELFRLFENKQQDSELRIHAYLAVMQCINEQVIDRIRTVLGAEEINQVGSFVWTHLTNLAETSCPLKIQIKDIISDPNLLKEFDVDKRKFSRNIELSTLSELFNVGAGVDSNLIWSTGSYVPRSANLNLTINMFGESVNLLEIGGRAQGMEEMLERYFGPGKEFENAMKRDKRAVVSNDAMSNIDRRYPMARDATQLSYFLRVFGNEIKSGDLYNIDVDSVKNKYSLMDLLNQMAQDRSIDFTRSFAFLDSNLVIPTGVGMPLKLGVEGTVTVGLKANGKVDVRQIMATPSSFDVTGSVQPSAALQVEGDFGVDARVARTRLRITNTMHTSTLMDGRVTLKDGQVFNADFNMPQQKLEIFSSESHFYVTHRDQEREQMAKGPKAVQMKRCTDPTWANKLGFEVCGELSYPTGSMIPLAGPAVVKIYVNKLDTFTSARLEASIIRNKNDMTDVARFSFTTPGSRVDRELTADFKLDRPNKDLSLTLKTPWKKVAITGKIVDQPALKKSFLKAMIDDKLEYSITAELAIAEQKVDEVKYTPNVKVVLPGREPIVVDGLLTYLKGKKVSGNISIKNALREAITAEGSIQLQDKTKSQKYDANIQFSSPALRGSVSGYVSKIQDNGNTWASRADINYQYMNGAKQRIVINHKLRDASAANLKSYSTDGSWTTTMWPRYNGNFAVEEQFSPTSLRVRLDAGFDSMRKIVLAQSGVIDVSGTEKKLNGMLKFELPFKSWNYEMKLDHVHNPNLLQSNATIKYDENREHSLDLGLRKDATQYLAAVAEGKLKIAGRPPMTFKDVVTEKAPREYHNELNVDSGMGKQMRAVSVYKMGQRHELTTEVQATGVDPINIKAQVNPTLRNMQARVEVKHGPKEYMTDLSWVHRGTNTGFNTRGGAEFRYLTKSYGLSAEVSSRNQDYSATLEAKCGENRKATLSGTVTVSPTAPKLDMRLDWLRNFVAFTGGVKYEPQGWKQTANDLEASAKIMSSFQGLEEMGGMIRLDVGQDSVKSNGEVSWAKDRKITGDLSYDKSKTTINIATPFNGYRTIKGDITYQMRSRNAVNGNAKLQWESNQVVITGSANYQRGRGYSLTNSGELSISTPWRGYRESKLTWSHQNDDGTMWKCHHELELEGGRKYVMDIDGTRNRIAGVSHMINLKSTLTTPIQGYEQLALTWEMNHDYRMIKNQGKASISRNGNTISLEHDVSIQLYNTFVVKAKMMTPYRGYEVMGIDLDNKLNPRNNAYTLTNELSLGDPRSKVNLDGTLNFNGPTFNTGIRIRTPHPRFPQMVFNLRNGRQQDGSWALHGDLEYSPDKTMTLDGKLSMDRMYGLEISATSPFENMRTMSAKAVSNVRSAKNFDVTVEVTHNLLRDKIKYEIIVDVESIRTGTARIATTLQTPFKQVSLLKLSLTHTYQSQEKCLTSASYEFNEYKGQFTHDQTVRSSKNFDGKTRLEYVGGRTLTFDHRVVIEGERGTITATLNTPFNNARSVELNINSEGNPDNYKLNTEVTLNRRDKISVKLDRMADPNSALAKKASIRITTPYQALQKFVYSSDTTGSSFDRERLAYTAVEEQIVEYNDKRWYAKKQFEIINGAVKINGRLETPNEWCRTAELKFTHTPKTGRNGNGWSNSGSFEINDKKYTGESEYIWVGNQLRAKLVGNVPEEYSVVVNHKADRNEVVTGLTLKAGPHATGVASFKMNPTSGIELKATVETPYRGYEKFDMNFKHEGPVSDFKTTANLSTPFRDYRNFAAQLTYRGNPNDFTASMQIDTPFRSMPKFAVSANHKMDDRSGLDSGASLVYGDNKKIAGTMTFKNDGRTARVTVGITTPYQGYESFNAQADHTGTTWRNFRTNAKLTTSRNDYPEVSLTLEMNALDTDDIRASVELGIPRGKMTAAYSHSGMRSGEMKCSLEVTTPYRGYERFTLGVEHQGGSTNPRTKISVSTPVQGYENFVLSTQKSGTLTNLSLKAELTTPIRKMTRTAVSWTHAVSDGNAELKGLIETSYPGYEKFSLAVNHMSSKRQIRSSASVETSISGYERFAYNIDHSLNRKNLKTSVTIDTPFQGYDKFGGTVEFTGSDGDGFRASAEVNTPIQGYKTFGVSVNHAGVAAQFETSGSIKTPFRAVKQIDYTLRHRGSSIKDFATSLTAEYSGKKIEVESSFKLSASSGTDNNYDGRLKVTTPCPYFKDLLVVASHNRKPSLKTGVLAITLNSEKKIDLDYSYTTGGDKNIVINVRDPYPLATNMNMGDSAGTAEVNWDPTDESKKIRFDFGLKNIETATMTDRYLSFKTMIPRRTVGFAWGYTLTQDKFSNKGELLWTADSRPDFTYEIEGSRSVRRNLQGYDGKIKVASALLNVDTTFSHKSQPGVKHTTEIGVQTTEKLSIKSELTLNGEKDFTHTLRANHPRYFGDFSIVTETKNGNSFTTTLNSRLTRHPVIVEGQLIDQSRRGENMHYSGKLRLAHETSNTDVLIGGHVYVDSEKLEGNVMGQYKGTRDRQMKIASLRTEINRIRRELTVELTSPIENLKLSTVNREYNEEGGVYRYDVIASVGGANYKSTMDISCKDRSADLKLYTNKDDYIEVFGQLYSPSQSSVELSRVSRGQKIIDARASTSMSEERILTGYAKLRPGLLQEIQGFFNQLARDPPMIRSVQGAVERIRSAYVEEMQEKKTYFRNTVVPAIRSSVNAFVTDFSAKVDEIQAAFDAAYRRNDFYMRDIHQALKRHYEDLSRRIQYKTIEMQRYWQDVKERMRRTNQIIAEKWNEFCDSLEKQTRPIRTEINERMQLTKQMMDQAGQAIRVKFMESIENIRRQPWFQKLSNMRASDWLQVPAQVMENLKAQFGQFMYKLDYWMEQTSNKPELIQLRETILRFIEENKWMYQYLGLEQQVTEFIYKVRAMNWRAMKGMIQQSASEFLKLNKNKWTMWDPRKGEYAFEMYVPMDMPDLTLLQQLDISDYLTSLRDALVRYMPDDDWTLLDTIYAYKPKSDVRDWVPPFKAHATLTGSQHYMTFDRHFFEFAGECSYLLARDFIGKTFSVIVNYDKVVRGQAAKKSMTVISDDKQIEIFPDGKIMMDGSRTELPLRVGNTTISRHSNTITVTNSLGVEITCDLSHDHCTVAVSGWYYGKTAGLMGTYDNEPYNDMTTIDKAPAEKPETMAEGWAVGARCRPVNRASVQPVMDETTRRFRVCAQYFSDETSPFRTCFRIVNPEPFMTMCVNDVPMGDNSLEAQKDVCRTAAAYVHECRRQEVHIRTPSQCVRCEVPFSSDKFYEGETKSLSGSDVPKTADIVFVVQHASCNKDIVDKVKTVIDDLDKALRTDGLKNSQYAVVGFGGQGYLSSPSIRTMDGQIFSTANKVPTAFSRFDVQGSDSVNVMQALRYAAKLPFRAGASKSIVLIPCDSCTEQTVRYSEIQRVLIQLDIHLHMLVQEPIMLKTKSPKTAFIFGVDDETVYTSKDVSGNDLAGEADLRKYIRLPKDLCVALTQDTKGSVFSARQWADPRPVVQKKFVDVWVRTISHKAAPTECQKCECVADETGSGMNQCSSCTPHHPIYNMMPNFFGEEFNDNIVPEVSQSGGMLGKSSDSEGENSGIGAYPKMTTPRPIKRGGDKITRKPKAPVVTRKIAPTKKVEIPRQPIVRDQ